MKIISFVAYHKLKFVMTPWVHWPETMMTYDLTEKILFSGDAFGSFGTLDGGIFDDEIEFEEYYKDSKALRVTPWNANMKFAIQPTLWKKE